MRDRSQLSALQSVTWQHGAMWYMRDCSQLSALQSDTWQQGAMWLKITFALHPTSHTTKYMLAS